MNKVSLWTGGCILAATTNATIIAGGGYTSSQALVVVALSAGVFAGAHVIGSGKVAGHAAWAILAALLAGEAYNLTTTAERAIIARETTAAPLKDAAAKHQSALDRLAVLEASEPRSAALELARADLVEARAAVEDEARDIRCGKACERKQGLADKADAAVKAAIPGAVAAHKAAIEAAKADVAANPLPASSSPLADRLGWAPWALDLIVASLLSIGANGLAGVLIAIGSKVPASRFAADNDTSSRSFFSPGLPPPAPRRGRKRDPNVVDFVQQFRDKNGRNPNIPEMRLQFPSLDKATLWRNATAA